jgi:hypothetical protein
MGLDRFKSEPETSTPRSISTFAIADIPTPPIPMK